MERCDTCQRKYLKEKARREEKQKRKHDVISDDEEAKSEKASAPAQKKRPDSSAASGSIRPHKVQKSTKTSTTASKPASTTSAPQPEMYVVNPGAQAKIDVPPIHGTTMKWVVFPVFLLPDGAKNE